jgi:16S rRNA (cytosine967-C5)-methyltransferase
VKPRTVTARGVAITALVAAESGERANIVVPRLLSASGLDERDRGFATELAYGTLRMCRPCDWLVGQFARGELEPVVRAAARAGAYQLAFMRVPSYAAVSATVAEAPPRARPLLNAVLRRVAGLVEDGPPRWPDLGTRLSYPDWVIARLGQDLGPERALAALEQMNVAASPSVRPDGYVQDPGSQAVAEYMAGLLPAAVSTAGTGRVLDVCAAPGGKATLLARSSPLVVGADLAPARAKVLAGNVDGLGLANLSVVIADGVTPPFRCSSFAGVLVDAPCSGLGVLRRRPDARWRVRPADVGRLAGLQQRLLGAAAPLVAPGGVLVYSVCTLTSAETAEVGSWLNGQLGPGWAVLAPPGPPWEPEPLAHGALLLPQAAGTDGMYVLAVRRLA